MDFGKPIHPADAAEYLAEQLNVRARHLRNDAAVLRAKADALEEAAGGHLNDASMWRRFLPERSEASSDQGDTE